MRNCGRGKEASRRQLSTPPRTSTASPPSLLWRSLQQPHRHRRRTAEADDRRLRSESLAQMTRVEQLVKRSLAAAAAAAAPFIAISLATSPSPPWETAHFSNSAECQKNAGNCSIFCGNFLQFATPLPR